MTNPQRYLTRTLIFLALVAVVVIILIEPVARAFGANPALNGLILGTLILGLVFSLRQIVSLKSEVRWIERFRRADDVAGAGEPPRLLAPMAAMLGDGRTVSLSAFSMRTLLDGIAARMDEGREISRYLIGLLIFLGLLGTFWGLLGTITSIGETIRSLSVTSSDMTLVFDALKEGLQSPLSGMGTAFSSSLFGLAGSLILGFVDLQAGQAQNRFFNDLEDWLSTVTKLGRGGGIAMGEGDQSVPSYVSALLEQTAESLDNLQRTVTRAEDSRGDVNAAIRSLSDRLETLTDQRAAEQDLLVKLVEAQNETRQVLGKLAETLSARPGAQAPVLDEATRGHLRNLDLHVKHILDGVEKGRDELLGELRAEIKLLARTLGGALDSAASRNNPVPSGPSPAKPAPLRATRPGTEDDDAP